MISVAMLLLRPPEAWKGIAGSSRALLRLDRIRVGWSSYLHKEAPDGILLCLFGGHILKPGRNSFFAHTEGGG